MRPSQSRIQSNFQSRIRSSFAAVALAALLAACSSSPTQESTGEYLDDATITTRIKGAFLQDNDVKAGNIQVTTYKGKVQLSGYADSDREIIKAVQLANGVPGVKSVQNDIRLK